MSNFAPDTPPTVTALVELMYKYYPRWHKNRESLDEFLHRAPFSPETQRLEALVERVITDNTEWHALLREVQSMFPDYWVADGRPPGVDIPSYQLVLAYEYPPGSSRGRYLVFRISFLAPVFDFYESERDEQSQFLVSHLTPTPESAKIASTVGDAITRRFSHIWLDPDEGNTPLPGIGVGDLLPGQGTLADALFEDSRRW